MKKIVSLLLLLLLLLPLSSCALPDVAGFFGIPTPKQYYFDGEEPALTVHFIDVGQGDSTLLESGGEFVLIDAGEREYGDAVVDFIEKRGCDRLKYVIATHPHSDHVGGLADVINSIDCENFITSETDQSTRTWLNVLSAVEKNNVDYIDAEPGDTYSFGSSEFTILGPLSDSYSGYNDYSVVTLVKNGDISFLLTGDAEKTPESEMVRYWSDLSVDVLKCGHHGSSTSTTEAFLDAVDPSFAVISCGEGNEYGHPHRETIEKLTARDIPYFRTDELGTVTAYTNGSGLRFSAELAEIDNETYTAAKSEKTTEKASAAKETAATESYYIGNKNSKLFHRPGCGGVKTMSEKNKVSFSTREEAEKAGYSPCSSCDP